MIKHSFPIRLLLAVTFACSVVAAPLAAPAFVVLTFDDPIQLDPTYPSPPDSPAPVWRADRFPAAIFESAILGGENVLELGVSQGDREGARGGFNSSFYNFQGYKLTMPGANSFISADIFIPSARPSDLGAVNVGIWGSGFAAGDVTAFPIIAYRDDPLTDAGFYYWAGAWEELVLGAFEDAFHTLRIELDQPNDQFLLSVTDEQGLLVGDATSPAGGAQIINELFLNMANTFSSAPDDPNNPQTFSAFIDNVSYTPEPSRAVLVSLSLGAVLLRRCRSPRPEIG